MSDELTFQREQDAVYDSRIGRDRSMIQYFYDGQWWVLESTGPTDENRAAWEDFENRYFGEIRGKHELP